MARAKEMPGERTPLSTAAFQILLALADGDRHGYGVMQEIEQRTAGRVRLGPGTLYGALKRMLDDGWVEELEGDEGDERRRYYHLTPGGRQVARQEAQRLAELVVAAQAKRLISPARWA
jgi:DNA-binding PadR family transcriptional regulator